MLHTKLRSRSIVFSTDSHSNRWFFQSDPIPLSFASRDRPEIKRNVHIFNFNYFYFNIERIPKSFYKIKNGGYQWNRMLAKVIRLDIVPLLLLLLSTKQLVASLSQIPKAHLLLLFSIYTHLSAQPAYKGCPTAAETKKKPPSDDKLNNFVDWNYFSFRSRSKGSTRIRVVLHALSSMIQERMRTRSCNKDKSHLHQLFRKPSMLKWYIVILVGTSVK